jgi:alkylhydroperoxidase family enzyme
MPYLEVVDEDRAEGLLADLFASERRSWGYLPNLARTLGIRPDVYAAWRRLNGAIKATMPPQRYELATVAAAAELRSSYCSLAHGKALAGMMPEEQVIAVVEDRGELEPLDRAIVALSRKIVRDAPGVRPADIAPLRAAGLADDEIYDVILAVSARCFFSTVLDATGTSADEEFLDLPAPLREALTVGRPIGGERTSAGAPALRSRSA